MSDLFELIWTLIQLAAWAAAVLATLAAFLWFFMVASGI